MSWKLAEMRWRHELGVSERCQEREREPVLEEDDMLDTKTNQLQCTWHGRSYTAPWCREMLESNVLGYPVKTAIRPDPMLALSSEILESSTTPLLQRTHSATKISKIHGLPANLNEGDMTELEPSLRGLQTPPQPTSFPRKPNPFPQLDGVQQTWQAQGDGLLSFQATTPAPKSSRKSRDDWLREAPTTPQRPCSSENLSITDAQSPFDFEFARTPSFGLHFHRQSQPFEEKRSIYRSETEPQTLWTRSLSLSPILRRTSLESAHHSDSALLQNVSMNISACSSYDRRVTRPIYPDLPSAYARIQGHRARSLQAASSSRSGTRFPLSPSGSSSEEDAPVALHLGNDAVPLRNLPCRRVRSAHVVLHEVGDEYLESSAIFETSDEILEPQRRESRTSTTLEEIVSQYADADQSSPPFQIDELDDGVLSSLPRLVFEHGNGQGSRTYTDPFHTEATQPTTTKPQHDSYQTYQQREEATVLPVRAGLGAIDDAEEWETAPESSRSGLFTPSKLRFGLRKRKTADTSSSHITSRSPASLWDPLSNSTETKQSRPRPHFRCKDHVNCQQDLLSPARRHIDTATANRQIHTRHHPTGPAVQNTNDVGKQRSRVNSDRNAVLSPRHPSKSAQEHLSNLSKTRVQPPPGRSSTLSTSHALASSSLLPKFPDKNLSSGQSSHTAMHTSNEIRRAAVDRSPCELPSWGTEKRNKETERFGCPVNEAASVPAQSTLGRADNPGVVHVESPGSAMTFRHAFTPLSPRLSAHGNQHTQTIGRNERALRALYLQAQSYTLDDSEISRFLRDSRFLRHGVSTVLGTLMENEILIRQGVGVTGSSLADLSSDSSTLDRSRVMNYTSSGSRYSDDSDPAGITKLPTRRVMRLFPRTDSTAGLNNFKTSSVSSVHATTDSANRSLMLRRHGEPVLICNELPISVDVRGVQRKAGTFLLVFGLLAYLPGGWALIHSMGEGGPLATTAMAELTRVLVGREAGVVSCVHPTDAAMARAIERAAAVLLVLGAFAWLAVACWAATTI